MRIACFILAVGLLNTGPLEAQPVKKDQPVKVQTKTAVGSAGAAYGYNGYRAYVPNYPTDILSRYFNLDEQQQKQNTALRTEIWQERNRRLKEVDAALKEEFGDKALAVLNEEQKQEYIQIQKIMKNYAMETDAANAIYLNAYEKLFGQKTTHVPWSADGILPTMPTLTVEERQVASKAAMKIRQQSYKQMNDVLKASGIERPTGRDMEAWKAYTLASSAKRQELMAQVEPQIELAITEALSADMKPLFKTLLDARIQTKERQSAAADKYQAALENVIGAERAQPKTYRNWGGQRTQKIQVQPQEGDTPVDKKALKEI